MEGIKNGSYSLISDSLTWTFCHNRVRQIQSVLRTRQSAAALSLLAASLAADQGWAVAGSFYLRFIRHWCFLELFFRKIIRE
jgi:hypothetical protein